MSEFSVDKWNKLEQQTQEWQKEFEASAKYQGLAAELQQVSSLVILTFTEFQYKNFTREPKKWTATSLEETLLEQFPSDFVLKTEDFTKIQPILAAYFAFLDATGKIKNAATLLKRLEKSGPEMVDREANPVNWSAAKKAGMKDLVKEVVIKTESVDLLRSAVAVPKQKIPAGKRCPIHVEKVGRNDLCPCGSGKKYKKCCGA